MSDLTCTVININLNYYVHIVPVCGALSLSFYLLFKTRGSLLSRIFLCFVSGFSTWLILDLIAWMPIDYNIMAFTWSLFDYFNIIFFLFGLYFFLVLITNKDIEWQWKTFGFILTLFPLYQILSGNGIQLFNLQTCEALSNPLISIYKNCIEVLTIIGIIFFGIRGFFKAGNNQRQGQIIIVGISLLVFFITFAGADYLSVKSEIYEIGLFSLFIIPIFIGLIVYAVLKYKAFNVDRLKAQLLVATLILFVGSQFLFIDNYTSRVISLITFFLAVIFGIYLIKEVEKDIENQKKLESAYVNLKELEDIKSQFISFGAHQTLTPVTLIKGYISMLRDGNYGQITTEVDSALSMLDQMTDKLEKNISNCLNLPKLTYCKVNYNFQKINIVEVITKIIEEYRMIIRHEDIHISIEDRTGNNKHIPTDIVSFRQAIFSIIENCIKNTQTGFMNVCIISHVNNIELVITHKGRRIPPKVMPYFINSLSKDGISTFEFEIINNDMNLYVANKIINLHKGRLNIKYDDKNYKTKFKIIIPISV